MDMVSSHGYAWGYIGSCIPFVISLVFVLMYEKIGITMKMAMALAFFINAAWWLLVTIPLLRKMCIRDSWVSGKNNKSCEEIEDTSYHVEKSESTSLFFRFT